MNSVLLCCRFVTDEYQAQIRYSCGRLRPNPGLAAVPTAPGLALDAETIHRPRGDRGGYHPRCRDRPGGRVAAWARQGEPHHQRALRARGRRPYDQLTIFSALTLEKPRPKNLLEQRFIT